MHLWYSPFPHYYYLPITCKQFTNHVVGFLVGSLIPLLLIVIGIVKKFPAKSAMPLVVSCSAAISANCHRPDKDIDAWRLPVRWGIIDTEEYGARICSFTTLRDVKLPEKSDIIRGRADPKREKRRILPVLRRWWRTVGRLRRKGIDNTQILHSKEAGRKTA